MQQFCNGSPTSVAFIADGLGRAPCSLQLTNAGQLALVDSIGATWTANMQLIAPTPTSGILPVGNVLQMVTPPPSPGKEKVAFQNMRDLGIQCLGFLGRTTPNAYSLGQAA